MTQPGIAQRTESQNEILLVNVTMAILMAAVMMTMVGVMMMASSSQGGVQHDREPNHVQHDVIHVECQCHDVFMTGSITKTMSMRTIILKDIMIMMTIGMNIMRMFSTTYSSCKWSNGGMTSWWWS